MKRIILLLLLSMSGYILQAQKIAYSDPEGGDFRQNDFDIIGKVSGNILIFQKQRNENTISIFDTDMKEKDRVLLKFLPDKIINSDFIAYPDFCYMFYQYQKRNIIYAMAAKIDGNGKIVGEPIGMDTTEIGFLAANKIYSLINSDDKQYIGLFKINSKNDEDFVLTTMLYNRSMEKVEKNHLHVPMPDRHDFLTEFQLTNTGNIIFLRAIQESNNDKVHQLELVQKKKGMDELKTDVVNVRKVTLDDVRLKVDNYNNIYIITSFFSKTTRDDIGGLYTAMWNVGVDSITNVALIKFDDDLRSLAKGDNNMKDAFNDYYIKNIIVRKDGGFLLAAESLFSTGRSGGYNRLDYMYGSPFLSPMDYYMFPYGYGSPWSRYNNMGQSTRYNAQNILVFSMDNTANISWTNVISKNQYDDETEALISYSLLNSGDQIHFLFNQQEKRMQLMTSQSISPSGVLTRNPTLKNLSTGYEIMVRYGKQTGQRQIIFPCLYRNYLCFARLDL